jgi:predicted DNA-binding transcriptional regulator AlpA
MYAYHTIGLIHALPPTSRRGFDRKEAASYVGVSPTHFDKLIRNGTMPQPYQLLGRKVWDRSALDRVLDALAGLDTLVSSTPVCAEGVLDRELAAFEAKHGYA